MLTLPDAIVPLLLPFATLFTNPTWQKAQLLLVGAILTPGQRTVAAALRVMGRSDQRDYARYHEVLNRAVWSPRAVARILLLLLLQHLDRGDAPLVFGIDETLERRRGPRIRARGIYRDAVRSSRHQLVKASGLRWISPMWLGHVPWAGRHWALPVFTVLAPSSRYYQQQGRRHKKFTDWARQMVMLLRRWLPHRPLVLVGDNGYAVLDLLHCCQSLREPVTLIARLRLDAALYAPAPPRQPGQNGRPSLKGPRRHHWRPGHELEDQTQLQPGGGCPASGRPWTAPLRQRTGGLPAAEEGADGCAQGHHRHGAQAGQAHLFHAALRPGVRGRWGRVLRNPVSAAGVTRSPTPGGPTWLPTGAYVRCSGRHCTCFLLRTRCCVTTFVSRDPSFEPTGRCHSAVVTETSTVSGTSCNPVPLGAQGSRALGQISY